MCDIISQLIDSNNKSVNFKINEKSDDNKVFDLGEGTSSGSYNSKFTKNSINSFSDDLTENILQYLSFEDKVLLESVSKQWRRTIYNRQTILHLNSNQLVDSNILNKLLKPILINDFPTGCAHIYGYKAIKRDSLESILKKCKSIKTIQFSCYCDRNDLELIGKYCNELENLELSLYGLNEQILHEFGLKYGQKLKGVKFYDSYYCVTVAKKLLNNCKNLLEFTIETPIEVIKEDVNHLPKLTAIKALNIWSENYSKVAIIGDKYGKTLRHIEFYSNLTTDETLTTFSVVTKLQNLKYLKMELNAWDESEKTVDELICKIGESCTQIQQLFLSFYKNSFITERFFYTLQSFHSLKRLEVNLFDVNQILEGSVQCFRNINLKYLLLRYEGISDQFFNDIHIHLPNLKSIEIDGNRDISDKTIISLSKLKYLKTINFLQTKSAFSEITDYSICELLELCSDIEVMTFSSRPNITHKTIDKLLETALKYPNKNMNLYCGLSEERNEQQFVNIQINDYIDLLPQNLQINIIFDDFNEE